jgi:tetratricopeptide (TPR) repeat protein
MDPDNASAHYYRGDALNRLGRVDEAMEALLRSLELRPGNARAYYAMGILYDKKHLPGQAAEMYRKARELTPR